MAIRIPDWARSVLERSDTFATLATISADGSPHQAVIWYTLRGDSIVVNSKVGRLWPTNLIGEPRFGFLIENAYEYLAVRGLAETLHDPQQAQHDIAEMARRYHDDDAAKAERIIRDRFEREERISFLLHPTAVSEHPER